MTLINIAPTKPSPVMPPDFEFHEDDLSLLELVLKFVYCETLPKKDDNGNPIADKYRVMALPEEIQMKFSIDWWYKAVMKRKEQKIIRFKMTDEDEINNPDEIHLALMRFASLIRKKENKDVALMRRLKIFKFRMVDYRKVYKLPGSHKAEDFKRARTALNFWNEKNPELA